MKAPKSVNATIVDDYGHHATYRRCAGTCSRWLPLGSDLFYAHRRDEAGNATHWRGSCKDCSRARITKYRHATRNDPVLARARDESVRKYREAHPEKMKEWGRARYRRDRASKVRWRKRLESQRLDYRLRRERRDGVAPASVRSLRVEVQRDQKTPHMLPAAALAAAIDHRIARESGDTERVCFYCGIDDRQLRSWRSGEWTDVQLNVADRVLIGLGLLWWDVWEGADAEIAQLAFEGQLAA